MTYTYANHENTIISDGQGTFIPTDADNIEYRRLVENNVTIEPYVTPPAPVPDLTARQFFSALMLDGIITESEAINRTIPASIDIFLNTLPDQNQAKIARITWAQMVTIPRNDPLVDFLGAVLNKTPTQIDDFFRQAATL